MEKRIITIGRECGSGGHTIGKLVAERLGISRVTVYNYLRELEGAGEGGR